MRRGERTVADEVKGTEVKQSMPDARRTIRRVRAVLRQERIGITVMEPSYGEGSGIVPILASLRAASTGWSPR